MNDDTLLHRQVHPSWVQLGRATSQAFRPTPKDERKLSVYDGDQISAEAAWKHYTNQLAQESVGVMAVSVGECFNEQLQVVPDPTPCPEHTLIDFSNLTENQIRKKSKRLQVAAQKRGWQYQVEGQS
jgi:hypothetical protein